MNSKLKSKPKSRHRFKPRPKKKVYDIINILVIIIIIFSIYILIVRNTLIKGVKDSDGLLPENIDTVGLDNIRGLSVTEMNIVKNISKMKLNYLFVGLPGTGKTELAKSIAKHNKISLYTLDGTETSLISGTETNIRNLYNKVKKSGGGIIFIDELERFCAKRTNGGGGGASYHNDITSYILQIIHETVKDNIIWIAACNDLTLIDDAIINRFNVVELDILTEDEKKKLAEHNIEKILSGMNINSDAKTTIMNHIITLDNRGIVKFLTKIRGHCNVNNTTKITGDMINKIKESRFYGRSRKRSVKRSTRKRSAKRKNE